MDAKTTSDFSSRVVAEAESWLGTPWRHHAATKGVGVDCAMLLIHVYANVGIIEAFDPGWYVDDFMLHQGEEVFLGWVEKFAERSDSGRPGDVVLFKVGRVIGHGGILQTPEIMIHADRRAGEVVRCEVARYTPRRNEDLTRIVDYPRLAGYWRLKV